MIMMHSSNENLSPYERSPAGGEKQISGLFQSLPRKSVPSPDKKRGWFRIQNYIRETRPETANFWHFLFLRKIWGQVLAIVVIVLVAVSIVGGVARATPGETLYGVKKAAEKVERVLAPTETARVKITIKHAKRRLEEVQILVAEDHKNGVVSETLNALTNTTQDAVAASKTQPELKGQILELTSYEEKVLTSVQTQVEGQVKEAVEKALLSTKESLSKLNSDNEIQGAVTQIDDTQTSAEQEATSTASETVGKTPKQPEAQEGVIQSEIQIHGVITIP